MSAIFDHHAYLLSGDRSGTLSWLKGEIAQYLEKPVEASSDYFEFNTASFSVDDSRILRERAETRGLLNAGRFFVVSADSFTIEAQNALLKLLEEPVAGHHFYLLVPDEEIILPTLKSRLSIIYHDAKESTSDGRKFAERFLREDLLGRQTLIDKFIKTEEDDEDKLLRVKVKDILNNIEKIMVSNMREAVEEKSEIAQFLHEILRVKSYLNDVSPSPKIILEYLSFILPNKPLT